MKIMKLLSAVIFLALASCSTVRVASDYDDNVNFSQYKTYAYFKDGIDNADISDLDKKRILRAIDEQFAKKGFTKSDTPDFLVNIFTKTRQEVDVNSFNSGWGYGWGYGWSPLMWGGGYSNVYTSTQGTLYIDIIDAKQKEMVWQGVGTGVLSQDRDEKQKLINEFVEKITAQFPPEIDKK